MATKMATDGDGPRSEEEAQNVTHVRALVEAWNQGDLGALSAMWAPNMVHHGRDNSSMPGGQTAAEMGRFLAAFPDLKMNLESIVADGDTVCTRIELVATHLGHYLGAAPTAERVHCRLMGQLRFANGLVVEHWGVADGIALLHQIGLIPDEYLQATA